MSFRLESRRQAEACYAFARYLAGESGDRQLEAYALGLESSLASMPASAVSERSGRLTDLAAAPSADPRHGATIGG